MLKAGYKKTDVGVIPEDWELYQISNICLIINGGTPNTSNLEYWAKGIILWCTPTDITREKGKYLSQTEKNITEKGLIKSSATLLPKGALLLCSRATIGEIRIAQQEMCTNQGIKSLICKTSVYNEFIYYKFLTLKPKMLEFSTGSTFLEISKKDISNLKIALPQLVEQQAIATALSDMDALIESLEQLIQKKRDIKTATMQQLLTGKICLPGSGGKWQKVLFGKCVKIRNEKLNTFGLNEARFCIELEHIRKASGTILTFDDASHRNSYKYSFKENDVLFGRLRPYLKKYWYANRSGVCSTEIWPLINTNNAIDQKYLFYLVQLESFTQVASNSYGTHMPRIDWGVLKAYEIRLPNNAEQQAIATILSDMDSEIEALEQRLEKTRFIKWGMMQELLTGRTRLLSKEELAKGVV